MTKKYKVFGIGNALVDMEFEVTEKFLLENNVEKGLMTLVEQERQAELLEKLSGIQHKRNCGGSAANTVIAATQLGASNYYSCKVANDETGEFYYSDMKEIGVRSNIEESRFDGETGKCMVLITPDADRTMNTYLGITSTYAKDEIIKDELINSEWLYIEGYLVTGPNSKEAAIYARDIAQENGVKVALTLSDPGIVGFFKDGFKEIIGTKKLDLIFCNEEEAMSFTGQDNLESAMESLKELTNAFAITTGPKGAVVFDGAHTTYVLTNKVDAIDTNGAGDLFAGSFLYAITNGSSYGEAARFSCACSSKLVTQFGARLKTDQILDIKKQYLS